MYHYHSSIWNSSIIPQIPTHFLFIVNSYSQAQPQTIIDLHFTSIVFLFCRMSYKRNHTVCSVSCLASFTYHNDFWYISVVTLFLLWSSIEIIQFVWTFTCWWTFGLLSIFTTIKFLCTFMYRSLCGHMLSLLLNKLLGVRLLNHVVGKSFISQPVFQSGCTIFHF